MAQNVVYADLKFAAGPSPTASPCPTDSDENDSPYENVPVGPVPVAPSPGRWLRCCRVPRGLLAASLLLLLVATVSLGACYWQVTRRLQDTSQEHAAEQGHLSQELSMREQSLEQAQLELAWIRAELQRAWQEGNSSQLKLSKQDAELEHAKQDLAVLEGQLRASESTVSSLRACVNTDCCPSGWVLYRSKCLFVSMERKSWEESCNDCRKKSARLLIQEDWPSWTTPYFLQAADVTYWIGEAHQNHHCIADGLNRKSNKEYSHYNSCPLIISGKTVHTFCTFTSPWICEKSPDLSNSTETLFPFLAKGSTL